MNRRHEGAAAMTAYLVDTGQLGMCSGKKKIYPRRHAHHRQGASDRPVKSRALKPPDVKRSGALPYPVVILVRTA
jgi:hypothetical protein